MLSNLPSVVTSASLIAGLPLFWNALGRNEYYNHTVERLVGSKKGACYIFVGVIFSVSFLRDVMYVKAIQKNPAPIILPDDSTKEKVVDTEPKKKNSKKGGNNGDTNKNVPNDESLSKARWCTRFAHNLRHGFGASKHLIKGLQLLSYPLFAIGTTLVVTSAASLGVTGTYLGDYCGILMDEKVVSFPFNILDDPMYVGGAINFFATALKANSLVGIGLSTLASLAYMTASKLEGPFLAMMYANRSK